MSAINIYQLWKNSDVLGVRLIQFFSINIWVLGTYMYFWYWVQIFDINKYMYTEILLFWLCMKIQNTFEQQCEINWHFYFYCLMTCATITAQVLINAQQYDTCTNISKTWFSWAPKPKHITSTNEEYWSQLTV